MPKIPPRPAPRGARPPNHTSLNPRPSPSPSPSRKPEPKPHVARGLCLLQLLGVLLDGQEELELGRQVLLGVEAVGEVDAADAAVGVDLHAERLNVVGAVRAAGEVAQVELDLVPAIVQAHRHGADKRLDPGRGLIVGCAEPPPDPLVVLDLHLEREVLLQVLDDHDEERQLDGQRLARVRRRRDVRRAHVRAGDLQHARLDVLVGDALDVAIAHPRAHISGGGAAQGHAKGPHTPSLPSPRERETASRPRRAGGGGELAPRLRRRPLTASERAAAAAAPALFPPANPSPNPGPNPGLARRRRRRGRGALTSWFQICSGFEPME
mmetsp:Transcript_15465/g.46749  ORF Transcript_15465/g.46749 Transcript_15465/m.46749 type:complete len:324 (+) Transcript_15465:184-1155(+)